MTQKERQERSKREILKAAREEFGVHGYGAVTMDAICSRHGISKGMMYHYYANKDALFLLCVGDTFQALRDAVEQAMPQIAEERDLVSSVKAFFMIRESFFQDHPEDKNIFEDAMLRPPGRLSEQIRALHQPLRELNRQFLLRIVAQLSLRPGIDAAEAAQYLESMADLSRLLLQKYAADGLIPDAHNLLKRTGELIDWILFGVARQDVAAPEP